MPAATATPVRLTEHRMQDDLLTAGLGLSGLRALQAPAPSDPENPTPAELRRRAIYTSWRGIADLRAGEFGERYGQAGMVPGQEWSTFLRLPDARHSHRALVQVPDRFDAKRRCLIVTASSGSRGIYGAIAVAGAFGLTHGCAVAYTDKAAGSGVFDFASQTGVQLDGTRAQRGSAELEFEPDATANFAADQVAFKHAHSGDFPDAQWGQQVLQAAEFGLHALDQAFPDLAPFTAQNTRILAVGLSNGGGAALRAAELDQAGLIDAVVVAAPNITAPGAPSLLEYACLAALLQPCALPALNAPRINPLFPNPALIRCAQLQQHGLLDGNDQAAQSQSALAKLRAFGFREATLATSASNVELDLWRSILATYLQSYTRASLSQPSCDYRFAPTANVMPAQRALWSAEFSGLAPSAGIMLMDGLAATNSADPALPGLLCAYTNVAAAIKDSSTNLAAAIGATLAQPTRLRVPTVIVHGSSDGLIPIEFTSTPYVNAARSAGAKIALWQVDSAQHFDAFLAFPSYGAAYVPLLEPLQQALKQALDHLENSGPWPEDRVISRRP